MGRYTFFDDFFKTDIMNHVEVLKEMMRLGVDDDRLLVPALINMSRGSIGNTTILPFYRNHRSMPKNTVRMIEVHDLMQDFRGHNFNVFECCCLDPRSLVLRATCVLSVLVQSLLFGIITYYNFDNVFVRTYWNTDILVGCITFATTIFFAKMSYDQYRGASIFNNVFSIVGDQSPIHRLLRFINMFVNGFLGILITFFNFFFLLNSDDPNEAILNSLALYFILGLDDAVAPSWDDRRIDDEIGINIHDYIMGECRDHVKVTMDSQSFSEHDLLNSDDRVYVEREGSCINVFWRRDASTYDKLGFKVSGEDAETFLNHIDRFYCLIRYRDIHD